MVSQPMYIFFTVGFFTVILTTGPARSISPGLPLSYLGR